MGLMDILNGMQNGPHGQTAPGKGGMSPLTMALLALLAYKAYNKMSAGHPQTAPTAPSTNAGGGLGGALGGLLGGSGGGLGGLLQSGLGGLLAGGAAGGVLSGGLGNLVNQLQQAGLGDEVNSWVAKGQNKQISPHALSDALGDDTIKSLLEQTGLSKSELLAGLSDKLPQLVDALTPDGRVPNEHEMQKMI